MQDFAGYAATALAGLGDLPDTIMSRAVIVRMRKRSAAETIEPIWTRVHESPGHALRARLAEWAALVGAAAGAAWPELPPGVEDRKAEIWEPLIAVADQAGEHWPDIARQACVELCAAGENRRASLGVRLLGDLQTVFGDADALPTATILARLCGTEPHSTDVLGEPVYLAEDAPWSELRGRPFDSRGLARILRKYDVVSAKIQHAGRPLQGYRRADLWDTWQRYLPAVPAEAELVEPPEPVQQIRRFTVGSEVQDRSPVPEPPRRSGTLKPAPNKESSTGSRSSGLPAKGDAEGADAPLIVAIVESIQRTRGAVTAGEVVSHLADWPPDDLADDTANPGMLDSVLFGMRQGATP